MASSQDLERIALSFPGVVKGEGKQISFGLVVKGKHKGVAWEWMERVEPKKPKVPNPEIYAFRTRSLMVKEMLLADDTSGKIFTEPHYDGYAAVLVRLELMSEEELRELFEESLGGLA